MDKVSHIFLKDMRPNMSLCNIPRYKNYALDEDVKVCTTCQAILRHGNFNYAIRKI